MNFLQAPVLWFTELAWVRSLITESTLGRRFAGRFVAGDTLDAGMRAAVSLAAQDIRTMLDHLGENVESPAQAAEATDAYVHALKRIQETPEIDCNISVKLTQLGLDLSTDLCAGNMERVLQAATGRDGPTLVMIDMEASEYVDRTLDLYTELRTRYANVGVCLQAYLHRTAEDVRRVGVPGAVVRMAKGAYLEPPEKALQSRSEIRRNFARLAATLLCSGSTVHLATHDPTVVEGAKRFLKTRSISTGHYEFQMLYGIRRDLQAELIGEGEPVRVYVPYGTRWYPYLTRRLAERPANIWFFISNALRRGG